MAGFGIRLNSGQIFEGDAAAGLTVGFKQLPVIYNVKGTSPAVINASLVATQLWSVVQFDALRSSLQGFGVEADSTTLATVFAIIGIFVLSELVRIGVRYIRTKQVLITREDVRISYPFMCFRKPLTTPLSEYRGLTLRRGQLRKGKKSIDLHIAELLHMDNARTVPLRITKDADISETTVAEIAMQLAVDHLVSSFSSKHKSAHQAPEQDKADHLDGTFNTSADHAARERTGITAPPANFNARLIPAEILLANGRQGAHSYLQFSKAPIWKIGSHTYAMRISSLFAACALSISGYLLPDKIMLFFGAIWIVIASWRLFFGVAGYQSINLTREQIIFTKDSNSILAHLAKNGARESKLPRGDITDIRIMRQNDGRRDEMVVVHKNGTVRGGFSLDTASLTWLRHFIVDYMKLAEKH